MIISTLLKSRMASFSKREISGSLVYRKIELLRLHVNLPTG